MKKARMTTKRTKDKITYKFTESLQAALANAKEELERKVNSQERVFLKWQHEKAKKAYEAYERRIEDLKGFIRLAEEQETEDKQNE